MFRRAGPGRGALPLVILAGLGVGCYGTEKTSLVPTNPFGKTVQPRPGKAYPESMAATARVASVGLKVVTANKQLGLQPHFLGIGSPNGEVEIFHTGAEETATIWVSEALVSRCQTDAQLAAVLCRELARMIAEREAHQRFTPRNSASPPPLDVRVGSDYSSISGSTDNTRLFEMAKFEKETRRQHEQASNPDLLARSYLQTAGYSPQALTEIAPLLRTIENSKGTLEKQLNPRSTPFWGR